MYIYDQGFKMLFTLSHWSDFFMTDSISITVHIFASYALISFSVDETLFPKVGELLPLSFRNQPFNLEV